MEMVWFFPIAGKLSELHLRQYSEAASDGVGCVRPKIPIFLRLFDIELRKPVADISLIESWYRVNSQK